MVFYQYISITFIIGPASGGKRGIEPFSMTTISVLNGQ